jgi:hypothetical protein
MNELPGLNEWEAQFLTILKGASIKKAELFNVNPKYFAFDPDKIWVLDGGISLTLSNEKTITYCWNKEMELMDMIIGDAAILFGDLDYYTVEDVTARVNVAIAGKTIDNVSFEWNWYQKMDENFELEDALNFAPLGVQLNFTDDSTLQLAAIQFSIATDDQRLTKVSYLTEGDLLVALNTILPIEMPDDETPE